MKITAANLNKIATTHALGSFVDEDVQRLLDKPVHVVEVAEGDSKSGSVDATLVVRVGDDWVDCECTLFPDRGRPTVGRRHPLGTCGSPAEVCWSGNLLEALAEAEERDEDFDRRELIDEVVAYVDEAARAAGL